MYGADGTNGTNGGSDVYRYNWLMYRYRSIKERTIAYLNAPLLFLFSGYRNW